MFACIYVPDFPVEAIVRAEPLLRERAVAVLEGKPPLVRVAALNEKARWLGIEAGMTKLQAEAFVKLYARPAPHRRIANKMLPCCTCSPAQESRIALCSILPMLLLRGWKMRSRHFAAGSFRDGTPLRFRGQDGR